MDTIPNEVLMKILDEVWPYDKVQETTTSFWDNRKIFVKKILRLGFFMNIDMLYTTGSEIERSFRISRF